MIKKIYNKYGWTFPGNLMLQYITGFSNWRLNLQKSYRDEFIENVWIKIELRNEIQSIQIVSEFINVFVRNQSIPHYLKWHNLTMLMDGLQLKIDKINILI